MLAPTMSDLVAEVTELREQLSAVGRILDDESLDDAAKVDEIGDILDDAEEDGDEDDDLDPFEDEDLS